MSVTVYGSPGCVQCTATHRALEQEGVEYESVDVNQQDEARQAMQKLGYRQLPVVVAGDDHWSGFQPDRIKAL